MTSVRSMEDCARQCNSGSSGGSSGGGYGFGQSTGGYGSNQGTTSSCHAYEWILSKNECWLYDDDRYCQGRGGRLQYSSTCCHYQRESCCKLIDIIYLIMQRFNV